MKYLFGIAIISFVLLLPGVVALTCSLSSTPCVSPSVAVFKMRQQDNSHVELPSEASYANYMCCSDSSVTVGNACSGIQGKDYDVIMRLYQSTNSHAQKNTINTYSLPVCLSIPSGAVSVKCDYTVDVRGCAALGPSYACVASLYKDSNSHVSSCDYYPIKVCCSVVGDLSPPLAGIVINNGTAATNDPSVILDLTFSDPESGIADPGCQYKNEGDQYTPLETCVQAKSWTLLGNDGQKTVYYKVFNTLPSGNATEVSDTIILDRAAPTIAVNAYPTPANDSTPTISGAAADATSNINRIQYRVLNTSNQNDIIIDWTDISFSPSQTVPFSFTTAPLPDGHFTFSARAYDLAGNKVEIQKALEITIDSTPPQTADSADITIHSSPYTISLVCNDNIVGCKETKFCMYDEGTNPCTPSNIGNKVDIVCPPNLICKKIIRYFSTDTIGNQEQERQSVVITVDNTRPSCTMVALSEYTTSFSIPLSWDGTDPNGKNIVNFTVFYKNGTEDWKLWQVFPGSKKSEPFTANREAKYQFYCIAKNELNVDGAPSSTVSTTVDATPPSAFMKDLPVWTNVSSFIVEWTGADTGSQLDLFSVEYKEGSGSFVLWKSYESTTFTGIFGPTDPVTVQDGKTYFFRTKAKDNAGLEGQSSEVNTTIDFSPPQCTIDPLPEWTTTGTFVVEWSGSDAVSGVQGYDVQLSFDSANWSSLNTANATNVTVLGIDGKTYYFRCRAKDNAGNRGSFSSVEKTNVDNTPPRIEVRILPTFTVRMEENVTIKAAVTDARNISAVELTLGGSVIQPQSVIKKDKIWNLTWSLGAFDVGNYNFSIKASDSNGKEDTQEFSFSAVICLNQETQPCGSNIGTCEQGTRICEGNQWGPCLNGVSPTTEICDGQDEDCDNENDNDLIAPSCPLNRGVCAGSISVCRGSLGYSICGQAEYGPQYEESEVSCDGLDNDCNGITDENCQCNPGEEIECGTSDIPPCRKGKQTCGADRQWGACSAVEPEIEACSDGIDNNCNGETDEECSDTGFLPSSDLLLLPLVAAIAIAAIIIGLLVRARKGRAWSEVLKKWS